MASDLNCKRCGGSGKLYQLAHVGYFDVESYQPVPCDACCSDRVRLPEGVTVEQIEREFDDVIRFGADARLPGIFFIRDNLPNLVREATP